MKIVDITWETDGEEIDLPLLRELPGGLKQGLRLPAETRLGLLRLLSLPTVLHDGEESDGDQGHADENEIQGETQ